MDDMKAHVYVKVEDYKDIVDIVTLIREKLRQAKMLLDKVHQLKAKEDAELTSWTKELEDVEHRIANIDRTLFEK